MIAQGADGLSRGDMYEGVMSGSSMLSFIPLHLTASERSPQVIDWVKSWVSDDGKKSVEVLTPEGWFTRGHDHHGAGRRNIDGYWMPEYKTGIFIWEPPPGVARFAVEQLRQARMKRQNSTHVLLIPRLMTPEWRRNVIKAADLLFEVPVGHPAWPMAMHEPLTVAVVFPYLSRRPWELRKTGLLVELGGKLRSVLKEDPGAGRNLLSELCLLTRQMDTMSIRDLCKLLRGHGRNQVSSKQGI